MTVKNGVIYGDAISAQEKKRIVMQKKKDRKAKKVRKSAQQTIPYVEMCRDGICKVNGSMMTTISIAEVEMPRLGLVRKKIGTPAAAASAKQMSCRFVRLNMTFVLTRFRSFGTGTNAIGNLLSKRDAALDLIAPYIPNGQAPVCIRSS